MKWHALLGGMLSGQGGGGGIQKMKWIAGLKFWKWPLKRTKIAFSRGHKHHDFQPKWQKLTP